MSHFYVTDHELKQVLTWQLCYDSARAVLDAQARGELLLTTPRVEHLAFSSKEKTVAPSAYRVKGAAFPTLGIAGLRAARTILFNRWPGLEPLGVVEERTNYAMRVGAVTAVALEALGAVGFDKVCLLGAGRLARTTLQALAHRFELGRVEVFSRTRASSEAFAGEFAALFDGQPAYFRPRNSFDVVAGRDMESAIKDASLVITITTANTPLFHHEWVADDAVVVSMGGGHEIEFGLFDRAGAVFVDDLEGCLESGDLAAAKQAGHYPEKWVTGSIAKLSKRLHASFAEGPVVLVPRGIAAMDIMQAYRALQVLSYL